MGSRGGCYRKQEEGYGKHGKSSPWTTGDEASSRKEEKTQEYVLKFQLLLPWTDAAELVAPCRISVYSLVQHMLCPHIVKKTQLNLF